MFISNQTVQTVQRLINANLVHSCNHLLQVQDSEGSHGFSSHFVFGTASFLCPMFAEHKQRIDCAFLLVP